MNHTRTIGEVAALVRSKNAGPFWLTIDIFCDTADAYNAIAAPGVINPERIAALYRLDATTVKIFRLDDLRAVKISFPHPNTQGGVRDRDMHSGQQHVPLVHLPISTEPGNP